MVCFNLTASKLSWSLPQHGAAWQGVAWAVPSTGLWELGVGDGVTWGYPQGSGEWLSPPHESLAETKCPALLAAVLGGTQRYC